MEFFNAEGRDFYFRAQQELGASLDSSGMRLSATFQTELHEYAGRATFSLVHSVGVSNKAAEGQDGAQRLSPSGSSSISSCLFVLDVAWPQEHTGDDP